MNNVVIIGFGASSLNLKALLSANTKHERDFYFLDSLDPYFVEDLLGKVDLVKDEIYIISKSGSTSETNLLAKLVIKNGAKNIKILCGNKDSTLGQIAKDIDHVWIDFIGENSGRFALLTKPFLDIASLAGVDTHLVQRGADSVDKSHLEKRARILLNHFKEGRSIWVIMLYSKQLFGLFMWIRQIVSESLGKNAFGILPFLCEGSMDEHSQLQLFLDGPCDKFYEIISSDYDSDLTSFAKAQKGHAIKVSNLLEDKDLPYDHIHHQKVDAYLVGRYIATYLNLVKIMGEDLGFDPLNQPAVESMKKVSHED